IKNAIRNEHMSEIPPCTNLGIHNPPNKKVIDATLSDYANIYIKCCFSELDQRPVLGEVSKNLENLSEKVIVEFIANCININSQQITQLMIGNRLGSSNNITENLNVDKHHEDNQDESNDNL
ncbi:3732_t:CDS:2, partial [Racocetra persica]